MMSQRSGLAVLVTAAFVAGMALSAHTGHQTDVARAAGPVEKARIVFVNGSRIVGIGADGRARQTLTFRSKSLSEYDEVLDRAPRVSPDGSRFLFLRDVDLEESGESTRLMVAWMGGGAQTVTTTRRLTPRGRNWPDVDIESATWNQDGTRIVFSQTTSRFWFLRSKWVSQVRSIKPDGTGLKTILTSRLGRASGEGYVGPGIFRDLDISPTSGRILATRERVPGGRSDLVAFDVDSERPGRLVRSAKQGRWSPDGQQILFLSDRDKTGRQCYEGGCEFQLKIYTARLDGTGQRRVQKQPQAGTIAGADWSPDGSRIAFGSDRNVPGLLGISMEIYSIKPDGACLTWLTNGSPESWDPNWSPAPGFDTHPGACGATARTPRVDPLPSARPRVNGKPAGWPRLWLGPSYESAVLTFPDPEGDDLLYYDCALFERRKCLKSFVDLDSRRICWGSIGHFLEDGNYRGLIKRRGALVSRPLTDSDGNRKIVLFTGGQSIEILFEAAPFSESTTLAEYLGLVDSLRPVGRDGFGGTDLQPTVFDRAEVGKARRVANAMDRLENAADVAEKLGMRPVSVKAYARFHRDLERLGPVKQVRCRA
jgi:hypothetical protein